MKLPKLPEGLVTPLQGFLILASAGLLSTLIWPDLQIRRILFLQVLVFLQGILAIQIGEAEHGYGPSTPGERLFRLLFFHILSLLLVLPLLLVHSAETNTRWLALLFSLLFLCAHGFVWLTFGQGLASGIRSDGVRFVLKYGGFLLALFAPVVLAWPLSGLTVLPALWEGKKAGLIGLCAYLGLSGVSLTWWMRRRRSKGA